MKPPKLTKQKLIEYMHNPQKFREEQWVMDDGRLFGEVCQDWQREKIFAPIDARSEDGMPEYQLLYFQLPKKAGKTNMLAGEYVHKLLLSPFPNDENYIVAGDEDQAKYLFDFVKKFISRNPNFSNLFTVLKKEIIVESTEARLRILNSESKTKSGVAPDTFLVDEFWNAPDRNLWDTLFLGMSSKRHAQAIILTNAGADKESICYKIKELANSKDQERFYHFAPVGKELNALNVPWIDDKWLKLEKATTPLPVLRRWRRNEWVEGGDSPFMEPDCWNCFKEDQQEKISCDEGFHIVGIDFGLKKDAAAGVVLHRIGNKIHVDRIQRWQGSKNVPVQIAVIEAFISECIMNFFDVSIVADPWQMQGTLQKFQNVGIIAEEFSYTEANLVKLSQNLFFLFKNEALVIPHHEKLEEELRNLQIITKTYGYRIHHSPSSQDDITMALAMASLIAMERGIQDQGNIDRSLRFMNRDSIFKSGVKREGLKDSNEAGDIVKIIQTGKRIFT